MTTPTTVRVELKNRDGTVLAFDGQHLGHGTSHHPDKDRWFVVDIYKSTTGTYVIHTRGMTKVADEITFVRIAETSSAFEVVELLTVNHSKKIYIPRQSSRALAQAAQWDDDIRDAYINRAVV